jgi:hypothetical protein
MKLHPDLKKDWTDALRSGRFEQGSTSLRRESETGDQYCCLGVLCELLVEANLLDRRFEENHYAYGAKGAAYDVGGLPKVAQKLTGLSLLGHRGPGKDDLASLNDSGVPFTEIANIIDKEF